MDNFVVSARKYRPQKFEDVVGQQSIANTLKMAIKNNKLASAYLFCGPRGVGKTTCARIFAKAINCMNIRPDGEACEECESCRSFNEQRSINIQELNAAANNSVEDIRAIIDQVRIPPQLGKYKVIILDEVHMLSSAAGNALLKTLEEPPSYVVFILATTEKHKIMQTILSRCQVFDFNRMEVSDIVGNLKMVAEKEGITCDEAALNVIAQKADGGMRDALSIFDQVNNFSQGNITQDTVFQCINAIDYDYYFKMTQLLVEHDVMGAMLLFNEVVNKGFNGGVFINGLAAHLRDVLMSKDPATLPLLSVAESFKQQYVEQAKACPKKFLYHTIKTCDRCGNEYKNSSNKRLSVEITLIEAAQFGEDDAVGSGRCPDIIILKPLFKATAGVQQQITATALPKTQVPSGNLATNAMPQQQNQQAITATPPTPSAATPAMTASSVAETPNNASTIAEASTPPNTAANSNISFAGFSEKNNFLSVLQEAEQTVKKKYTQTAEQATNQPIDNTSDVQFNATDSSTQYAVENIADDILPDETNDADNPESVDTQDNALIFNDTTALKLWTDFSEHIRLSNASMYGRMAMMPVKCIDNNIVEVSMYNEMVLNDLKVYIPDIEKFMQSKFRNPDIRIQTKVMPVEVVKVITNPGELLDKLRKDNPEFGKIVNELGLKLGR